MVPKLIPTARDRPQAHRRKLSKVEVFYAHVMLTLWKLELGWKYKKCISKIISFFPKWNTIKIEMKV